MHGFYQNLPLEWSLQPHFLFANNHPLGAEGEVGILNMDNSIQIFQENGLFGAKDQAGEILISPQYKEMYAFSCGLSLVRNALYQYAYIDIANKQVIPFGEYAWCDPQFVCGFARVMRYSFLHKTNKWGIIDTSGNIIVPLKYDKIWTIKEKYIFYVKAFIDDKEEKIDMRKAANKVMFSGLNYINVYSVEEFKQLSNCQTLYIRCMPDSKELFFTYGCNIGLIAGISIPKDPMIAIVMNNTGKIFTVLMEKSDIGKPQLSIAKFMSPKGTTAKASVTRKPHATRDKTYYIDNEDERYFYDGFSSDEVESGLADAFEGDYDAYAAWMNS